MNNLAPFTTSAIHTVEEHKSNCQIVADKFIESCLNLDASIFEPYMKEDDVFEEEDKYNFLLKRKEQFAKIRAKAEEDFSVSLSHAICNGCSMNKAIFRFDVLSNASSVQFIR